MRTLIKSWLTLLMRNIVIDCLVTARCVDMIVAIGSISIVFFIGTKSGRTIVTISLNSIAKLVIGRCIQACCWSNRGRA